MRLQIITDDALIHGSDIEHDIHQPDVAQIKGAVDQALVATKTLENRPPKPAIPLRHLNQLNPDGGGLTARYGVGAGEKDVKFSSMASCASCI